MGRLNGPMGISAISHPVTTVGDGTFMYTARMSIDVSHRTDVQFLKRCLELARESVSQGDWPFGALVVRDGQIVSEGLNTARIDIAGHAEVNAIKKFLNSSRNDLSDCTLYTSFEPCPMCSFIIREYGVGRVVWGLSSPYWGGSSRWKILTDEIPAHAFAKGKGFVPPHVVGPLLKEETAQLFEALGFTVHEQ